MRRSRCILTATLFCSTSLIWYLLISNQNQGVLNNGSTPYTLHRAGLADQWLTHPVQHPTSPLTLNSTAHPTLFHTEPPPESIAAAEYCVNTPMCTIPDVNPWDRSISQYIRPATSLNCNHTQPDLTYVKDEVLHIANATGVVSSCDFFEVTRPEHGDDELKWGHKKRTFTEKISVSQFEFIKVYCYNSSEHLIYQNLHAMTPVKHLLEKKRSADFLRHQSLGYKEHLNVLMVGLDSVSRLNFRRQYPETHRILTERLHAYEMKGYNKVRDNTFINLVPMFLGKYVDETDWNEMNAGKITFDHYAYSWKLYSNAGYHTLFAEDAPKIAIWNFEKPGFEYSPADYYLRPYALAMSRTRSMWSNNEHCFGSQLETDIVLKYIRDFVKSRGHNPHFAFTFLTRPTYDSVNQNTDTSHAELLQQLIKDDQLRNTVLIYFSDHGARRGDILSTYIGKLEERLPALYISLPQWFRRKYPQITENLRINQGRLSTPFDVHATLDHILHFNGEEHRGNSRRGVSLLTQVSADRDCKSATINDHWCTCLQRTPVSTSSTAIRQAGLSVVTFINNLTLPHRSLCSLYILDKIVDGLEATPKEEMLTHNKSVNDVIGRKAYFGAAASDPVKLYLVTVQVMPGSGLFEATVRLEQGRLSVSGDISRISLYGNSSSCVEGHHMKKFCFCKRLLI